jgi:hypothetical protein
MLAEVLTTLAAASSAKAVEALITSIKNYRSRNGGTITFFDNEVDEYRINTDSKVRIRLLEKQAFDEDEEDSAAKERERRIINLLTQWRWMAPRIESPIEASRSTKEIVSTQLTILEAERNRLIPIAAREHWVALIFAIIAGLVFFTSIGLFIFATLAKGIPTLIASLLPGFLSKVYFSREATVEKRLKEISADLRESERTKERLEVLEEVLTVVPEEHRSRVLEDFTKKPIKLLPAGKP